MIDARPRHGRASTGPSQTFAEQDNKRYSDLASDRLRQRAERASAPVRAGSPREPRVARDTAALASAASRSTC